MQTLLHVLVVQPDGPTGAALAGALRAAGHEPVVVSTASWAAPFVREHRPDVVILERSAAGYEVLLDAIDDLDVHVPVVVTRFRDLPVSLRAADELEAAVVARCAEDAALRPWGRIAALVSRAHAQKPSDFASLPDSVSRRNDE